MKKDRVMKNDRVRRVQTAQSIFDERSNAHTEG
jgi:hypothetical protein